MADFKTLHLERNIACTPERLFHLMTDREARQKWSAPDQDTVVIIDQFDCRPGGREETRCGPKENPHFGTIGDFHIVSPEMLCFTETLIVEGQTMSVSLCSQEISPSEKGSKLLVALQITSLVGPDMFDDYAGGWSGALDSLEALATSREQ